MNISVVENKVEMGRRAAEQGAALIRDAIAQKGRANIIVATGISQFEMLSALVQAPEIRWEQVTGFHLDEYIGIPITHPASFRKYLWERFVSRLPLPLKAFHYIQGDSSDPPAVCQALGRRLRDVAIDVAFVGIGENGHLAFNDPPANFETDAPYLVVDLDEACRRQQLGEGWFAALADVPKQAISMSIRHLMKSEHIVASVADARKAAAVKACLQGPVTPLAPASILQWHANTTIYLDPASAALL